MIPIEDQVCTFEQAKILKDEFGLELESCFLWDKRGGKVYLRHAYDIDTTHCPAYSCPELGVMLASRASKNEYLSTTKYMDLFVVQYYDQRTHETKINNDILSSETQTRANLLIKCLREGYIKPEDLKL